MNLQNIQTAGNYKRTFMQFTISWNLDPRQYGQVHTPKLSAWSRHRNYDYPHFLSGLKITIVVILRPNNRYFGVEIMLKLSRNCETLVHDSKFKNEQRIRGPKPVFLAMSKHLMLSRIECSLPQILQMTNFVHCSKQADSEFACACLPSTPLTPGSYLHVKM